MAALLMRSNGRKRKWQQGFDGATAEVAWLAHTLIPQLQQQNSTEEVIGGWQVAGVRVLAAEDRLTSLEADAPGEIESGRARTLRDGLRSARTRLDGLVSSTDLRTSNVELAAVATSLETALNQTQEQPSTDGS